MMIKSVLKNKQRLQRTFATKARADITLNQKWLDMAEKETKGKVNIREKLIKETNEKMFMKPIYTKADWSPPENEEISGEFPFKRGHMATMYASRPWTVR